MPMSDSERVKVLIQIDRGYQELVEVLDSLSDDDMERPSTVGHWNGKDLLSHIAAWEVEGSRHVMARDAGEEDSIPDGSEFDRWNEEQVSKTREWTVEQIRAYLESTHHDFVEIVRVSPTITPGFATGLTSHHYEEHIDQFRSIKSPHSAG